MEIYTGSAEKVKVKVPFTATAVDVNAYDGDVLLHTFSTVTKESDGYSVTLPFSLVDTDKTFVIKWHFTYDESGAAQTYDAQTEVTVVTAYAEIEEIRELIGGLETLYTDKQLLRAERRVRNVINNYTGQTFGRRNAAVNIVGAGDAQLRLPDRLVSLESISGYQIIPDPGYYVVRGGGYYIGVVAPDDSHDGLYYTNPVRIPWEGYKQFSFMDNVVYTVKGIWGWSSVPSDVKEAALILIEDALDPDSEYRDRYIDTAKAADWTITYHDKAYGGTGSAMADQLLEPYKRWSMTVI